MIRFRLAFFGFVLAAFTSVGVASQAFANTGWVESKARGFVTTVRAVHATSTTADSDYQIGSEWGKKKVTRETLQSETPAFVRAALATAYLGGGTGFYLGKFNGHHIMASNYHVVPTAGRCSYMTAQFPLIGRSFPCEKFYGSWNAIDLSIFSIRVTQPEAEADLAKVARNFNFDVSIYPGQPLITIGFGAYQNPGQRNLMANEDSDCKVFSAQNDFRFMADPDQINPGDYKVWSFANGCDVSHGDSGSAMVDRQTGDVVGLIWTTATNKPDWVQDSAALDKLLQSQAPEIWTTLAYAVPAPAIRAYLEKLLKEVPPTDEDTAKTVSAVLNNSTDSRRY